MKSCVIPIICVRRRLGGLAAGGGEGGPRVRVSGAVQVAAVQREALRAAPVRAAVQLCYALQRKIIIQSMMMIVQMMIMGLSQHAQEDKSPSSSSAPVLGEGTDGAVSSSRVSLQSSSHPSAC